MALAQPQPQPPLPASAQEQEPSLNSSELINLVLNSVILHGPYVVKTFMLDNPSHQYEQGTLGKDYTWPSPRYLFLTEKMTHFLLSLSSIDFFMAQGFNAFRIPFLQERMSPPATGLTGPFNATYLSGLQTVSDFIHIHQSFFYSLECRLFHISPARVDSLPSNVSVRNYCYLSHSLNEKPAHNYMRYNNAIITSTTE